MVNVPHCKCHNANGCSAIQWGTSRLSICVSPHQHFLFLLSSVPKVVRRCSFAGKMFRLPAPPTPCHSHSTVSTKKTISVCARCRTFRCGTRWGCRSCRLYCDFDSTRRQVSDVVSLNRSVFSSRSIRTWRRWLHQPKAIHLLFSPAWNW